MSPWPRTHTGGFPHVRSQFWWRPGENNDQLRLVVEREIFKMSSALLTPDFLANVLSLMVKIDLSFSPVDWTETLQELPVSPGARAWCSQNVPPVPIQ